MVELTVTGRSGTSFEVPDLTRAAARRALADAGFPISSLLASPDGNPKVAKNGKLGVLTAPLHLAPAELSGYNVCAMATAGCTEACLHYAGRADRLEHKETARIKKTKAFYEARSSFFALLIAELVSLTRKADRENMKPGCRLNATSDIPWENYGFTYQGEKYANIMELFPDVSFYDYTKRHNRKNIPSNYHLTFSLAEDNDRQALEALKNGFNVAVVFAVRRGDDLPNWFHFRQSTPGAITGSAWSGYYPAMGVYGYRIIDGDDHDYRPADPKGVIVGLRAKGRARQDMTGFVRSAA